MIFGEDVALQDTALASGSVTSARLKPAGGAKTSQKPPQSLREPSRGAISILGVCGDAKAHAGPLQRSQLRARFRTVPVSSGLRQAPRDGLRPEHPLSN
ncbi:hypothetical protein WA1_51730 [Scytonema hofmannii PCC 7110]|jgi:hypothetical protein|uniref:Uncharacterized protein n=1 Tax=Scytonema hofmannii PCC 7110 TaxID=128403 RepID=A0A139WPV6_9CYAN|nr:hypothetical protein WA1_51730 [Scytonema hofmannii PCC 7110]